MKIRSGYDNPRQIFELLPLFEAVGLDFLILHSRTVVQKYTGCADHTLTKEVVQATPLPVIANGDINTAAFGKKLQNDANPAGLMLGRGGIADPVLFQRLRGEAPAEPSIAERRQILGRVLTGLLPVYSEFFCGEYQILSKLKAVLSAMEVPELEEEIKELKRINKLDVFVAAVNRLLP